MEGSEMTWFPPESEKGSHINNVWHYDQHCSYHCRQASDKGKDYHLLAIWAFLEKVES